MDRLVTELEPPQNRATRHPADDEADAHTIIAAAGWGDGLPVVVPTPERVEAMLTWAGMPADHIVGIEPVKQRALTAEKVAANAVLAGCPPPAFPVVATAVQAMCHPDLLVHGATASTGGCALLVIVSGPVTSELGMTSSHSALGGADPFAVTIGRAVRLVLRNLLDARPGGLDRSTLGHPGKLSYCVADDPDGRPWLSVGEQRGVPGDLSSVTVAAAGGPRQLMNEWTTDPAELAETFAAEIRANMRNYSIWGGNYTVVVPPQLRAVFHHADWSVGRFQEAVAERAVIERGEWASVGKGAMVDDANRHRRYSALADPADLIVVSAGGDAGGFGAVIPPWLGTRSRAVTVPIGACLDC